MSIPSYTSKIPFSPPGAPDSHTTYTLYGTLSPTVTPLICLHGGPGVPHNYIQPIKNLWLTHQVPVIFYDQLGCGLSTHLPEKLGDKDFWTPALFLSELDNLLSFLQINQYDLLGQSWGGMLAACHAIRLPKGLRRLVIADSPASMELWVQACDKLRQGLPENVQKTLLEHEKAGTTDSKEYEEAMQVFYDKHVCRVKSEDFAESERLLKEDNTVYMTM
jgi:proline-specific peptidase